MGTDTRTPGEPKKSLDDAVFSIGFSGTTSDERLGDILTARRINQTLGGFAVSPADVGNMDEATIDLLLASLFDVEAANRGRASIEAAFERFRRSHPTYRKH